MLFNKPQKDTKQLSSIFPASAPVQMLTLTSRNDGLRLGHESQTTFSSLSCFGSFYHSHKEAIEHTQLGYLSNVQKTKYPEHLFAQISPGIPFTKSVRQE